jgi:hypothetical protein
MSRVMPSVAVALAVTLAVEVPIVSLFYRRELPRMAIACALATSATNVAMNAWLVRAVRSYDTYLLVGELCASAIEALVYAAASRRHEIGHALIASGLANATSFIAGLALF